MFKPTSRGINKALLLSCSFLAFSQPLAVLAQDTEVPLAEADASTVIYGEEFIAQQNGMVTAIDLINRIPGGSTFLGNNNGGGQQRGFSSNDDPILINGQRVSGKSNSSRQALSQIPVDQVLRVEIIRGSSPDIKVSSQGALLNVVMRDDAGGAGSWQARLNHMVGKTSGEIKGSYSDKISFADYTVSLQLNSFKNKITTNEMLYDASGNAIFKIDEYSNRNFRRGKVSSNVTLHLNNGNDLNINGLFDIRSFHDERTGNSLSPDAFDELTIAAQNQFNFDSNVSSEWEIGMDYDTKIAENWDAKFIVLHSQQSREIFFGEDFDISGDLVEHDYKFTDEVFRSENIGRAALVWTPSSEHRLEFATELSFNERSSKISYSSLVGDIYVAEDIGADDVTIKEVRDETSIIHSWQISEKVSLDTAFTYEYSKISQSGDIEKQRTFNFLKPSWDLRYNQSSKNQFQLSARKNVSQLNFGDFASSYSNDNEIVGGNSELAPEQSWLFEASYEHRLDDDKGFIKPSVFYERISNKLTQIEVSPGVSGVGNAGVATRYGAKVDGAIRFFFIGVPNLQLSGDFGYTKTEITDPFTGEAVVLNRTDTSPAGNFELRHDFPDKGFFWQINANLVTSEEFRDIDEFTYFPQSWLFFLDIAAEKQIGNGLVLRVSYDNVLNQNFPRERSFYADGRAGGVLTSFENKDEYYNRQLYITIKGTF